MGMSVARNAALPCSGGSTGEGLGGPGGRVSSGLRAVPRPDTARTCPGNTDLGTLTTTRRRQGRGGSCHHLDERRCRRDLPVEVLLPLLLLDLQGKTGAENPLEGTDTRAHILQTGSGETGWAPVACLALRAPRRRSVPPAQPVGQKAAPPKQDPLLRPPRIANGMERAGSPGGAPCPQRGASHTHVHTLYVYIHTHAIPQPRDTHVRAQTYPQYTHAVH